VAISSPSEISSALEQVGFRLIQAVGGAFLFANSAAILTDAFPPEQRGLGLGINQVAGIAGSVIGTSSRLKLSSTSSACPAAYRQSQRVKGDTNVL
jgi:MFS family permease